MQVRFYRKGRGNYPVRNFIRGLPPKHQKRILKDMKRLEKYGLLQLLKTKDAKKIKRKGLKGLYELITGYEGVAYRIFFSITKTSFLMTHAFIKKSEKTPLKELKKAISIHKSLNFKK